MSASKTAEQQVLLSSLEWVFWGGLVATALFGATCLQTWVYTQKSQDGWRLRSFVYGVVLVDTATEVLVALTLHQYFVSDFGHFKLLTSIISVFAAEIPLTALVTFAVQISITMQVYKIRKSLRPLLVICALLATTALVCSIIVLVSVRQQKAATGNTLKQTGLLFVASGLGQASAAVTDVLLTLLLCYALWQLRTDHSEGNGVLQLVLVYCVNRGLLVAAAQILFTTYYLVAQESFVWAFFHLILSKLYTNTMLAIFNARPSLRSRARSMSQKPSPNDTVTSFSSPSVTSINFYPKSAPPVPPVQLSSPAFQGMMPGSIAVSPSVLQVALSSPFTPGSQPMSAKTPVSPPRPPRFNSSDSAFLTESPNSSFDRTRAITFQPLTMDEARSYAE